MNNAEELWELVTKMIDDADKIGKRPNADAIALQQARAQIVTAYATELVYRELQTIAQRLHDLVDKRSND